MGKEFAGIAIITALAVVGKLIEDCRKIGLAPRGSGKRLDGIGGMYECFNIHLNLSLGMLGLVWSTSLGSPPAYILFILVLVGVASKGVFSQHKPDRLNLRDLDARYGFFIPNACALASVLLVIGVTYFAAPTEAQHPGDRQATQENNQPK